MNNRERYAAAGAAAGCPPDQMRNFRRGGYVAQPRQLEFHAACRAADQDGGPVQIGFGGARGPGKSHGCFAQIVLDDCERQPGLSALFLRSVKKAARESFEALIAKVCPHLQQFYKKTTGALELPNGSRVVLGGYGSDKDIENYLGLEYGVIGIEENTLIPKTRHEQLRGSLRSSDPNWRARLYSTTNPGGVGHAWYKRVFVEPWRKGKQGETRFIFATYLDNAYLQKEYINYLNSLTGWLGRAWRDGDWDIAAGQFFTTWRRDIHIKPHAEIVTRGPGWTWWAALDYGFTHPTAVYLLAMDDPGTVYVLAEHCERKLPVKRHAEAIRAMPPQFGIGWDDLSCAVAGGDLWKTESTGKTIEQQYQEEGITFTRANMNRADRAARFLEYLGDVDRGIPPKIVISDRCRRLIECIPSMQHDPHQPEKVLKTDIDEDGNGGDDPYDALGYGLMEIDNLRHRGAYELTRRNYGRP